MEQNYRSSQKILSAANSVISKNRRRKEKELWTERDPGEQIKLFIAENERHEGELVANEIKTAIRKHELPDYRDFAVLYRTNAQSRSLEEVFMRYGIPYKIIGGVKFYERKEIKRCNRLSACYRQSIRQRQFNENNQFSSAANRTEDSGKSADSGEYKRLFVF